MDEIICDLCGLPIDLSTATPEKQQKEREMYKALKAEGITLILCRPCVKKLGESV